MIAVVTATTDLARAEACINSWGADQLVVVFNGGRDRACSIETLHVDHVTGIHVPEYLGSVPAFRRGVDFVLDHSEADIIACLHDDVQIYDTHWKARVERCFKHPAVGLAGFGGAIGLGDEDLYQKPYEPVQLARRGFRSNLVDAEAHGVRSLLSERVACLDGFSQIGRRQFFDGAIRPDGDRSGWLERPWTHLEQIGIVHHAYDGMLGCLAERHGWEVWYIPVACKHDGGRTAVGDQGYHAWAKDRGGDGAFWEAAHRIWYDRFSDVLPIRR